MITSKYIITLCETTELLDLIFDKTQPFLSYVWKNFLVIENEYGPSPKAKLEKVLSITGNQKPESYSASSLILINLEKKTWGFSKTPVKLNTLYGPERTFQGVEFTTADQEHVNKILNDLQKFGVISSASSFKRDIGKIPKKVFDKLTPGSFYHGTGGKETVDRILRLGLMPSDDKDNGSVIRGNGASIPFWTKNFVYLSPSFTYSQVYARTQSPSYPAVFEVQIPDSDKLFIDDDAMKPLFWKLLWAEYHKVVHKLNGQDYNGLCSSPWSSTPKNWYGIFSDIGKCVLSNLVLLASGKSLLNVNDDRLKPSSYTINPDLPTAPDYRKLIEWFDNIIPKLYKQIINSNWKKSAFGLRKLSAVGYKGRIPPKFLKLVWTK